MVIIDQPDVVSASIHSGSCASTIRGRVYILVEVRTIQSQSQFLDFLSFWYSTGNYSY